MVRPTEEQLGEIFAMKRRLMAIRKVVTPQRDMFAALSAGVTELPGRPTRAPATSATSTTTSSASATWSTATATCLSGVMDTHISTVSNRLNVVMKQLAIIATIFLPLSYLTGFFGQNFAWLVLHIGGNAVFFGLGVGTEVVAVVILFALFKRRGWLGGPAA